MAFGTDAQPVHHGCALAVAIGVQAAARKLAKGSRTLMLPVTSSVVAAARLCNSGRFPGTRLEHRLATSVASCFRGGRERQKLRRDGNLQHTVALMGK